jgi:hypothetical protein
LERVGPAPQTATVERDYAGSLRAADLARAGDSLEDAFSFLAGLGYRAFRFEPEGLVPVALPVTCDFWWFDPFVVILASPTALAGIIWILFATGTTLSVPALALVQIASTSRQSLLRRAEFRPEAPRSRPQAQLDLERRDVPV